MPAEGKDAVIGVVGIDPFEAWPVEVHLVERGFLGIQLVQVADRYLIGRGAALGGASGRRCRSR